MRKFASIAEEREFKGILIRAIVALIPGAVCLYREDEVHGFHLAGEEAIWVNYSGWKHRLNISGIWPKSRIDERQFTPHDLWNPKVEAPSISVDADKTGEQIAKDIKRRFLPAYRAVLARCQEARDNHDSYLRNSNGLAGEIGALLGVPAEGQYGQKGPEQRYVSFPAGSAEVSGDSVTFKLHSMPAEKAKKLAAFLNCLGL